MNRFFFACALTVCASAVHAAPNINVGTMYDYMGSGKSTYLKRVFNNGDATAFVRVNVLEITYDQNDKVTETPLDSDGPLAAQRKGLIASPARLIIPAKATQATRLVFVGERDRERYFRVRYVPVVPEKEDQFDVSDQERASYKEAMSAGVNIMTGYGTIVFVPPQNTHFNTKIHDQPGEYRVENAGNSTIKLEALKDCSAAKADDCERTRQHIIRPGKSISFTKEKGRVYSYELIEGDASKPMRVEK